jgi:ribosomal protein S18 acetylase RimI-like enzyme
LISIVPFSPKHQASLKEIFFIERKRAFHWMDTTHYTLEDFDKETQDEHILVALENDEVVGFISLWLPDNFIHHLYIKHTHTRKGIGRLLIRNALTKITKPVTLKCLDRNQQAIQFYVALGFKEAGKGIAEGENYTRYELQ